MSFKHKILLLRRIPNKFVIFIFLYFRGSFIALCYESEIVSTSTTYEPPFIYSYECTSALLTRFVNIFIYRYLITGLLFPFGKFLFRHVSRRFHHVHQWNVFQSVVISTGEQQTVELRTFPKTQQTEIGDSFSMQHSPLLTTATTKNDTNIKHQQDNVNSEQSQPSEEPQNDKDAVSIFNKESFSVSLVGDFAVLLTFGLAFSPLAFIITVSIITSTVSFQVQIVNLIEGMNQHIDVLTRGEQQDQEISMERTLQRLNQRVDTTMKNAHACVLHYIAILQKLEKECEEVIELFRSTIPALAILSALFMGAFLFDILGDEVGVQRAWWIFFVMGMIPSCVWLGEHGLEYIRQYWLTIYVEGE